MATLQKVGKTATTIRTDSDGWTAITYHDTTVVEFNARYVILRTGGWNSVTTKARMNQAANQFGLGYSVFQKSFQWFIQSWDAKEGRGTSTVQEYKGSKAIIDRKTGRILFNNTAWGKQADKWTAILRKIGYIK